MDRILFIDAHNAMHRACVSFGPPVPHTACQSCSNIKHPAAIHCQCGAAWDVDEGYCYGDRYTFVYNFFRSLRVLLADCQPDKCFFVLEGHPQFRYDLFGDYKANRLIKQASKQEANEKFTKAKDIIVPLLQHLPITTCRAHNYEADDVIGTLCEDMRDEDLTVISNDTDYIQLLQRGYQNIQIYNPIKKECMVAPDYPYVPWKCLNGDKSDNIPGLLKPKKALATVSDPELFRQFMAIQENYSNFQVNRQLIEFHPVPVEEIIIQEGARNFAFVLQAFERMKFASIINEKSWEIFHTTFDCLKY